MTEVMLGLIAVLLVVILVAMYDVRESLIHRETKTTIRSGITEVGTIDKLGGDFFYMDGRLYHKDANGTVAVSDADRQEYFVDCTFDLTTTRSGEKK